MNSIKQVPTRVRSRRVEANLGAEREHFEKQQVNAEERGLLVVFLWENICCSFTLAVVATSCVSAREWRGRDGKPRAPFRIRKRGLFCIWIKYLDSKTTLKGVYFTMRAWARWRVMSSVAIHSWLQSFHHALLVLPVWPPFSPPPRSDTLSYSGCVVGNQPSGAGPEQIWPLCGNLI